jgi:hypothetical protein
MNAAIAEIIRTRKVWVSVHSTATRHNDNGAPVAFQCCAKFNNAADLQMPLGYCPHRHRDGKAAETCGRRMLPHVIAKAIEEGRLTVK